MPSSSSPADGIVKVINGTEMTSSTVKFPHSYASPVVYSLKSTPNEGTDFWKRKDRKDKKKRKEEKRVQTFLSDQVDNYKGEEPVDDILAFINNQSMNQSIGADVKSHTGASDGKRSNHSSSNNNSTLSESRKSNGGPKINGKDSGLGSSNYKKHTSMSDVNNNNVNAATINEESENSNLLSALDILNNNSIIIKSEVMPQPAPVKHTPAAETSNINHTPSQSVCKIAQTPVEKEINHEINDDSNNQNNKNANNNNDTIKNIISKDDVSNKTSKNNKSAINNKSSSSEVVQVDTFKDTFPMLTNYKDANNNNSNNSGSSVVEFNNNTIVIDNIYSSPEDADVSGGSTDADKSGSSKFAFQKGDFVTVQKKKKMKYQLQQQPSHSSDTPTASGSSKGNQDQKQSTNSFSTNFQNNMKSSSFRTNHHASVKMNSDNAADNQQQPVNTSLKSTAGDGFASNSSNNQKQNKTFQDRRFFRNDRLNRERNDNNLTSNVKLAPTVKQQPLATRANNNTSAAAQQTSSTSMKTTPTHQPAGKPPVLSYKLSATKSTPPPSTSSATTSTTSIATSFPTTTATQKASATVNYFDPSQFPELSGRRNSTGSAVTTIGSGNASANDSADYNNNANNNAPLFEALNKKDSINLVSVGTFSYANVAAKMVGMKGAASSTNDANNKMFARRRSLQINSNEDSASPNSQSKNVADAAPATSNQPNNCETESTENAQKDQQTQQYISDQQPSTQQSQQPQQLQQHQPQQQQHQPPQQQQPELQPSLSSQQQQNTLFEVKSNVDSIDEIKQDNPAEVVSNSHIKTSSLKSDVPSPPASTSSVTSSIARKPKFQPVVFLDSRNVNSKDLGSENSGFSFIFDSNLDTSRSKLTTSSSEPCFNMLTVHDMNVLCQKICYNKGDLSFNPSLVHNNTPAPVLIHGQHHQHFVQNQQYHQQHQHFQMQQQNQPRHQFQQPDLINPNQYHITSMSTAANTATMTATVNETMPGTNITYPDVRVPPPPYHQPVQQLQQQQLHHYSMYPYEMYPYNSRPIPPLPPLPRSKPISRTPVQVVPPMPPTTTNAEDDVLVIGVNAGYHQNDNTMIKSVNAGTQLSGNSIPSLQQCQQQVVDGVTAADGIEVDDRAAESRCSNVLHEETSNNSSACCEIKIPTKSEALFDDCSAAAKRTTSTANGKFNSNIKNYNFQHKKSSYSSNNNSSSNSNSKSNVNINKNADNNHNNNSGSSGNSNNNSKGSLESNFNSSYKSSGFDLASVQKYLFNGYYQLLFQYLNFLYI
ncbi:hypothetical protein HELRODRAFT_179639 [Helobdella robusta]|uniref:Uncharacterized protein n=1 Tax=Helobdella robusta TaxID=6412 RepID=T1FEZ1_HELRO|nr:hypothetical protein HELRODRAFT_179639 [Helobdella robusta]ESN95293.1 hypothetical protein HELRODRAFT_179639 [Helobdella robusta]